MDANEVNGRHSDADLERLREEIESLRAQLADIQETLKHLVKIIEGNGETGLSRLLGEMHRTIQLQNEVISSLINKMSLEKILSEALCNLQAYKVAQFVTGE